MKQKRPLPLFFLFVFELFTFLIGIISQILISANVLKLPVNELVYLDSLGWMNYVFQLFSLIIFIGAIRLFLLKPDAYYFYCFRFASALFVLLFNVFFTNWLQTHNLSAVWMGTLIGLAIQIGIFTYVLRLKKSGLLEK